MNQSVPQAHYAEMGQDVSTAIEGGKKVVTAHLGPMLRLSARTLYPLSNPYQQSISAWLNGT